ncbi:MAG TPA: cytochrome P450 [Thermomicrobiales bacterium]|nr:cytochrome P450 [Thermomicrobiales bacterium]
METTADLLTLPFERPTILDTAPLLRLLQAERPIARVYTPAGDTAWLVTRHEDVKALFADERLGRSHPDPTRAPRISDSPLLGGPIGDYATEEADHARMRRALTPAFSARRMKALGPHVQALVDGLLDRMAAAGPPADLHEALSFPLPVVVICELLGVPFEDRERFRAWSDAVARSQGREEATRALQDLGGYMAGLIERKRQAPGEDVVSDLIAAQERGEIAARECVGYAVSLLFAGHETTVARIDYGTLLLLANPAQRERLEREPGLAPRAVEEILRMGLGGAGFGLPRFARADIAIGGVTIRAGEAVLLSLAAADRDGRVFAEPDRFDVGREPNPHLAFGYGSRYCLGASLARVELQAVFGTLLRRFPALRLAAPVAELRPRDELLTGGLAALPVAW